MSIYTVMTSICDEDTGSEQGDYGTFDAAMNAAVDFWNTSDAIHPDITTWVVSTKDDVKHNPEDYCMYHGTAAREERAESRWNRICEAEERADQERWDNDALNQEDPGYPDHHDS